jgi:hypothetical protein
MTGVQSASGTFLSQKGNLQYLVGSDEFHFQPGHLKQTSRIEWVR